ncbi:MAG: fatty acid desaturase [Planctomycetota bacterium]
MLIHVAAVAGLIWAPLPSWPVVGAALALLVLGGLGTTVCYHRALTHHGLVLNPVVEQVLIFFAVFNGSGKPLTWVANHRLHHATSDTDEDISSPKGGGFWWAHLRWLWQAGQASSDRYCRDLNRPAYRIWSRLQVPVLVISVFGGLALGWAAWLWLGPLRLVMALHAQCTVNSICHLGQPTAAGGSSRNVWWLTPFLLLQGENWHRNHHEQQDDPRLGQRWYEIDLGWWVIAGLRRAGLATDVRPSRRASSATPS